MSDKPETKIYGIPGDLSRLEARGHIRPARWTVRTLARRLDYLDDCIAADVVPDAKGRRERSKGGRTRYLAVDVPPELSAHMADLAEEVKTCRLLLADGDIAAASARMDRSKALVADMVWLATPASERTRKWAVKGGEARRDKLKPDTLAILTYYDEGHTLRETARKYRRNYEAVKKLVQRHRE